MRASIVVGVVLTFTACKHSKSEAPDNEPDRGKPVEATDVDRPAATGSSCSADSDCVISCDTKADCCSDPSCATAVMASAAQDVLTYRTAHCKDADNSKCPELPAPKFTVRAACQTGKCVAIKHG